jgi:hypothetical protein
MMMTMMMMTFLSITQYAPLGGDGVYLYALSDVGHAGVRLVARGGGRGGGGATGDAAVAVQRLT